MTADGRQHQINYICIVEIKDSLRKQEILIYSLIWLLFLLLAPLGFLLGNLSVGTKVEFGQMVRVLRHFIPIFILFLIHHFLLMPLLPRRKWQYTLLLLLLVAVYAVLTFALSKRPPLPPGPAMADIPPLAPGMPGGPGMPDAHGMAPPPDNGRFAPEMTRLALAVLVIGLDLGIAAIFNLIRSERRVEELENERLRLQLESLRYQINPHFFMNTLNNIQALVLTDPDKATDSISEFSKLMRILLYEGDAPVIPLSSELELMKHLISLMRLRYTEDVLIDTDFPEDVSGAKVPPLVMTSFIENAFKHGISYDNPSFVRTSVSLEGDRIGFRCSNSIPPGREAVTHGIGLANVRSRLDLLYGEDYSLEIKEGDGSYDIIMSIPSKPREAAL